jgi:hypothetical protein
MEREVRSCFLGSRPVRFEATLTFPLSLAAGKATLANAEVASV